MEAIDFNWKRTIDVYTGKSKVFHRIKKTHHLLWWTWDASTWVVFYEGGNRDSAQVFFKMANVPLELVERES